MWKWAIAACQTWSRSSTVENRLNEPNCNCIRKETCPLNQNCLAASLVYEATVTPNQPNQPEKLYIGLCEPPFKERYSTHKTSFKYERYKNSTTLSKEIWKMRNNNVNPSVTWRIVRHKRAYSPETNSCPLCLEEKYEIARFSGKNLIN